MSELTDMGGGARGRTSIISCAVHGCSTPPPSPSSVGHHHGQGPERAMLSAEEERAHTCELCEPSTGPSTTRERWTSESQTTQRSRLLIHAAGPAGGHTRRAGTRHAHAILRDKESHGPRD